MKIAMTLLVRDEADILPHWLRHHLPTVDVLIVTDNGSRDGSDALVQQVVSGQGPLAAHAKKVLLVREPDPVYHQAAWVSRMVLAANRLGAAWTVNTDADEFWVGDLRREIEAAEAAKMNAMTAHWYDMVPTPEDDLSIADPVRRMVYRNYGWARLSPHWGIHSTRGRPVLGQGHHGVKFADGPTRKVHCDRIHILHYPHRSFEQFMRKYIHGGKALELYPDKQCGVHWRRMYGIWKLGGDKALRKVWNDEILRPRSRLVRDEVLAGETGT